MHRAWASTLFHVTLSAILHAQIICTHAHAFTIRHGAPTDPLGHPIMYMRYQAPCHSLAFSCNLDRPVCRIFTSSRSQFLLRWMSSHRKVFPVRTRTTGCAGGSGGMQMPRCQAPRLTPESEAMAGDCSGGAVCRTCSVGPLRSLMVGSGSRVAPGRGRRSMLQSLGE